MRAERNFVVVIGGSSSAFGLNVKWKKIMLAVAVKGKGVVLPYSKDIIEDEDGGGVWCVAGAAVDRKKSTITIFSLIWGLVVSFFSVYVPNSMF
jgi:hypothetical protein